MKAKTKAKATKKVAKTTAKKTATKKAAKKTAKKTAPKKTATKKTATKTATPGFATLASWKRTPLDEADDLDFLDATNDSVAYEDCFGEEPSHVMVHAGSVRAAGPVVLDGWKAAEDAQQTVYVIDGDLEIDGALLFDQSDIHTTLWVTGDLTVARLACGSTAMLIVGGALRVGELVITDLEDAGHLIVHGSMSAPVWIDLTHGRGCIELGGRPDTRFLSDHYAGQAGALANSGSADGADSADDDGDDDEPVTVTPRDLAAAPATPALLPGLVGDGRPNWRKIADALRTGAAILA